MGRLRPVTGPPSLSRDVLMALRELYWTAGAPSVRSIARATGDALSHDTVYRVLTGPGLPRWEPLMFVVKALDGDVEVFRRLWITAYRAMEQGSV
jgi:DNA-binding phage protein